MTADAAAGMHSVPERILFQMFCSTEIKIMLKSASKLGSGSSGGSLNM